MAQDGRSAPQGPHDGQLHLPEAFTIIFISELFYQRQKQLTFIHLDHALDAIPFMTTDDTIPISTTNNIDHDNDDAIIDSGHPTHSEKICVLEGEEVHSEVRMLRKSLSA